jgi:hypothetical protein
MPEPAAAGAFLTPDWWPRLVTRIAADAEMAHVGRWSNLQLALVGESGAGALTFKAGKVVAVAHDVTALAADAVVMTGSGRAWRAFLQAVPPPQHNDVLAMDRRQPDFEIGGDRAVLIRNLRFIELVMSRCRDVEVTG